MLTGVIVSILTVLLLAVFLIYKKQMIIKMFALNVSTPANEFTQKIEQTADLVVKRLEDEAAQLELLLDEAEEKIGMLNRQVEHANRIIEQLIDLENKLVLSQQNNRVAPTSITDDSASTLFQDEIIEPLDKTEITNNSTGNQPVITKNHQLVIAMADQGYNVTEIAKATGMGRGEIMLLLQLNKK